MHSIEVLPVLEKLKKNDLNKADLNLLIEVCTRISYIYLKKKYTLSLYKLPPGSDLQEIAVDAIVTLFTKNNEQILGLKAALLKWNLPVLCEAQAQFFIHKVVFSRVEQHLCLFMKESDPFFGKILKTLNYYIKYQNFRRQHYFGTVYIVADETVISGRVISPEDFFSLNDSLFFEEKKKLISHLLEYLRKETDYYPAIPLLALTRKLKHIRIDEYIKTTEHENTEQELFVKQITQNALELCLKKLEDSYLKKGKINLTEYNWFREALQEITLDLCNGGVNNSLYDYLKRYCVNLDKTVFYKNYHQILDYMLRYLKNKIADRLN